MRRTANFDAHWGDGWPNPKSIERYFVGEQKNPWLPEANSDSALFSLEGLDNTDQLLPHEGRKDIRLSIWSNPVHGLLLMYEKTGDDRDGTFYSKGDSMRLYEWVRSLHGDPLPVGLFIPYERAWVAVKEFMETDGARSSGIEWISAEDLPPNTFPDRFKMPKT
jgi:hypothetical protein